MIGKFFSIFFSGTFACLFIFFFILLNYVEKQMLIITFKFKALIYHCIHFDFFYTNANHVVGLFSTENSTFTRIFVQWKDKKFHQYNFTFDVNKNSSKNILKIKKSELLLECQKKTLSKPQFLNNFFSNFKTIWNISKKRWMLHVPSENKESLCF